MATIESCKEAGKKALRQGDNIGAACHYTTALGLAAKTEVAEGVHLLYGNRSECYLRAQSWEEALEDALKATELAAGWSKGWYRAGQAAAGLDRPQDAYNYYIECLKCSDADEKTVEEKLQAVERLAWNVTDVDLPVLGRCLVAGHAFGIGETVLAETPVVHWGSNDVATRSAIAQVCAKHNVDAPAADVLLEVPALTGFQSRTLADMSAPEVDLSSDATLQLVNCAAELAQTDLPFAPCLARDTYNVSRLLLSAKTNEHTCVLRTAKGDAQGGLLRKASRVAHSCSPNLINIFKDGRAHLTALRPVQHESMLSRSYVPALDFLAKSGWRRKLELRDTHLFWCGCTRCAEPDHTRGVRCDCCPGAVRVPMGAYPPPSSDIPQPSWECAACNRTFLPAQLPLKEEEQLETRVLQLDLEAGGVKNKYSELKDALLEVGSVLGEQHWTHGQLCRRISSYFRAMAKANNSLTAVQVAVAFGAHYLCFLSRTRVYVDSPILVCQFATDLASCIPAEHHAQPIYQTEDESITFAQAKVALLMYALPLLKAVYTEGEPMVKTALELWGAVGADKALPPPPKHPKDPLKLLPSPPAVIGLFAQWEANLVQLLAGETP